MHDILSRTYNNDQWKKLPLTAKFERVVNEYIRLECMPLDGDPYDQTYATFGLKHWWYSPSKDFFWPHDPYVDKHPYLNARDWIYVGKTQDGQIDWLDHKREKEPQITDIEEHFKNENDDYRIE